uniref:Transmembrane protein n=1 Tax=Panagrolaimus sp. JU765 TaxID=591449 RepID=A0AC34QLV4_9BILA
MKQQNLKIVNSTKNICDDFSQLIKSTTNGSLIIAIDEKRIFQRENACPYKAHQNSPTALQILQTGNEYEPFFILVLTSSSGQINFEIFQSEIQNLIDNLIFLATNDVLNGFQNPRNVSDVIHISDEMILKWLKQYQEKLATYGTSVMNGQFWFGFMLILIGLTVGVLTIDHHAFVQFEIKNFQLENLKKE